MSKFSDSLCEEFKKNDDARDALLSTPEDVARWDNIVYGHEERKWQVLDVYRPKQAEDEDLPVIISVHGGGWVYGDKERYQYYCMSLAQRGFAVVNFTYRLAPKFKYPAPLEDLNLVCGWVMRRARRYHFDTERIFGVGDSAGAQLLGLYAGICTNPECAGLYDFTVPEGFSLTAIALNCGVYEIHSDCGDDIMARVLMKDFLPGGGTEEELAQISVLKWITDVYPPTFCMTSVADMEKHQALPLVQKLTENRVPFVFRMFGDKVNQLAHVFHCDIKTVDAAQCNDAECDFFREFCF
ncbi:MAG: alpha/beta hydrolase [Clostridiales bacterium]|nr:alpha/beta hydrolase [Clostridiales bacterium]